VLGSANIPIAITAIAINAILLDFHMLPYLCSANIVKQKIKKKTPKKGKQG